MPNSDPNHKDICFQIREELKKCLSNSNCVIRDKKTLKECLSVSDGSVPEDCQLIRNRYFHLSRPYCIIIMQYSEEGERLADQSACASIRADLKMCLLGSDCVKRDKKTPRECLKVTDGSVPIECQALRNTFFECKRSLLDNRRRFRGRKGY